MLPPCAEARRAGLACTIGESNLPACDTSQTVTPVIAAGHGSRLFFGARVKNMGTGMILGIVLVSPVVFSVAMLLCASEEWLQGFVELARSLGRPM